MTKKLRRAFPRLFGGQYQVTSKKTRRYNCIAWAAEHNDGWWEASEDGVWPANVPENGTVDAAVCLFESLGYMRTDHANLEPDVDKVAIYGNEWGYTHAARQLPDGRWTSKLGKGQDIEHDHLEALVGGIYGQVVCLMKRSKKPSPEPLPASTQDRAVGRTD